MQWSQSSSIFKNVLFIWLIRHLYVCNIKNVNQVKKLKLWYVVRNDETKVELKDEPKRTIWKGGGAGGQNVLREEMASSETLVCNWPSPLKFLRWTCTTSMSFEFEDELNWLVGMEATGIQTEISKIAIELGSQNLDTSSMLTNRRLNSQMDLIKPWGEGAKCVTGGNGIVWGSSRSSLT